MPAQPDAERITRIRTRRRLVFRLAFGLLALAAIIVFRRPLFFGNVGVVDPGRVYRSSQPRGRLDRLIHEHELASVLNLRGGAPTDPFYADEVRATRAAGIDFYDFPMSPSRRPWRRELLTLIDFFGRCKYPLLIHCKSGADRTGLASGVYLMVAREVGPEEAEKALNLTHGHVPLCGTKSLHEPFVEYAGWLKDHRLSHTPERFRRWVEYDYASKDAATTFRPLRPGPREQVAHREDRTLAR